MARLFVAVRPSPEVRAALEALPRADAPGVRWVPPEQWHVTLRFLGRAEPGEVCTALAGVELPRAAVVLGPRVSRLGRSVVALPASGLEELAAVVVAATSRLGDPPDPRPFHGHLTMARLTHRAACGVAGTSFRAAFEVGEVELVSSVTDPAGAIHEVVARFTCG